MNISKSVLCCAVAFLPAAVSFGYSWPSGTTTSTPVTFGSDGEPLASGTVEVPTEGGKAASITVNVANSDTTVAFEGGAIELGDAARLSVTRLGTVDFRTPVSAPGSLSCGNGASSQISFSGISLPRPEQSLPPVKVFSNVNIRDYEPFNCTTEGSNLGTSNWKAFNVKRGDGWLEVQYQYYSYWDLQQSYLLRSIKVRYEQDGPDVNAYVVYGRYYLRTTYLGVDTDLPEFDLTHPDCFAYSSGYGIQGAMFFSETYGTYAFGDTLSVGGDLTVEEGARVVLPSGAVENNALSNRVIACGDLCWRATTAESEFASTICGKGVGYQNCSLSFEAAGEFAEGERERTYAFEGANKFYPSSWTLVFTNALLSSITNVTNARLGGTSVAFGVDSTEGFCCFFRNDGVNASFLLEKWQNPHLKGVLVEMRQTVAGIEVRSTKNGYIQDPPAECTTTGYDFVTLGWPKDLGLPGQSSYNAKSVTYQFGSATRTVHATGQFERTDSSRFFYGSLEARGSANARLILDARNKYFGMNAPGVYHFRDGSVLETPAVYGTGATLNVGSGVSFYFHPGSEYWADVQTLPYGYPFVFDNAILRLGMFFTQENRFDIGYDSQVYLNNGTLRNGARIAGSAVRIGVAADTASMKVDGTSPSFVENDIILLSKSGTVPSLVTFEVMDVTGDAEPDLHVAGGLKFWSSGYRLANVRKTGVGTLRFGGVANFTNCIEVAEGTLRYSVSSAFPETSSFALSGGGLAFEADAANTVKYLNLSAAGGSIDLAAGASLTVTDVPAWTEGRLNVTLAEGAVLRFGTSACLPADQLRRIRVNGHRVMQNPDGTVTGPCGLIMLVR